MLKLKAWKLFNSIWWDWTDMQKIDEKSQISRFLRHSNNFWTPRHKGVSIYLPSNQQVHEQIMSLAHSTPLPLQFHHCHFILYSPHLNNLSLISLWHVICVRAIINKIECNYRAAHIHSDTKRRRIRNEMKVGAHCPNGKLVILLAIHSVTHAACAYN